MNEKGRAVSVGSGDLLGFFIRGYHTSKGFFGCTKICQTEKADFRNPRALPMALDIPLKDDVARRVPARDALKTSKPRGIERANLQAPHFLEDNRPLIGHDIVNTAGLPCREKRREQNRKADADEHHAP